MRTLIAILVMVAAMLPTALHAEASCELTPLTLPLFDATPLALLATPAASPAGVTLSEEEATKVLEQYVACTNTGDPTLVWAMFTPRWFSSEFADSEVHYLPAFEYQIANGQGIVVDPLMLVSIEEIELLHDGRVAVTATFVSADQTWTDQLILTQIDGTWFIDDVVLITPHN